MTIIVGILGAAILFGIFAMLRPRQNASCDGSGHCAGCAGDGACGRDGARQ